MKLTIRTLLAWLDGVLPPEEQRQLGAKVSDNPKASELVELIQLAIRKPMIGAPAPDGRGLADDPNAAAEFLDNTMSLEHLKDYEVISYESAIHLAEVAACHRMLAEIAGDASLQSGLGLVHSSCQQLKMLVRERLGQHPFRVDGRGAASTEGDEHIESRETARALRAALHPLGEIQGDGRLESSRPLVLNGSPDRPTTVVARRIGDDRSPTQRSTRAAWVSATIASLLLATLCGVLVWSVVRKGGRRAPQPPAADRSRQEAASMQSDAEPAAEAVADAPPRLAAAKESVAEGAAVVPAMPPAASVAADAAAGATEPMPRVAPDASADKPEMASSASAAPGSAAQPGPATAAPADAPSARFVAGEGTLLRWAEEEGSGQWRLVAPGSPLRPGEELLVPPWCEATLTLGDVDVRLLSSTNAIVSADRGGEPRIEVLCGRAVIIGKSQAGRIGVSTAGVVGAVATDASTRIAIAVPPHWAGGVDAAGIPMQPSGYLTAGRRSFVWQPTAADGSVVPGTSPLEVAAGAALACRSGRAAVATGAPGPAWLDSPDLLDRYHKAAAEMLAAKLKPPADGSVGRPLPLSLRELAADRRVENRMIAAATLATIGEPDALVEMLAASSTATKLENKQWLTLEAMSVPVVLARGGEVAAELHKSFDEHGLADRADLLWEMARGVTDADAANGMSQRLVEALDDPNLIVRRYAFKTLCDIAQPSKTDRLKYRPDGQPEQRRDGVAWWRGQLERGLIHR